jgi:hypothetical protein
MIQNLAPLDTRIARRPSRVRIGTGNIAGNFSNELLLQQAKMYMKSLEYMRSKRVTIKDKEPHLIPYKYESFVKHVPCMEKLSINRN